MTYILDTNLVIAYIRANEFSRKIEQDLHLFSGDNTLIVSVVTVGELKSIAIQNKWGSRKIQRMLNTLKNFLIIQIKADSILDRYAEIDAFSQGKLDAPKGNFTARNMGKNDLWIAATASVLDIELLTTDKDFQHLDGYFVKLKWIDLQKYL